MTHLGRYVVDWPVGEAAVELDPVYRLADIIANVQTVVVLTERHGSEAAQVGHVQTVLGTECDGVVDLDVFQSFPSQYVDVVFERGDATDALTFRQRVNHFSHYTDHTQST